MVINIVPSLLLVDKGRSNILNILILQKFYLSSFQLLESVLLVVVIAGVVCVLALHLVLFSVCKLFILIVLIIESKTFA